MNPFTCWDRDFIVITEAETVTTCESFLPPFPKIKVVRASEGPGNPTVARIPATHSIDSKPHILLGRDCPSHFPALAADNWTFLPRYKPVTDL